MLTMIGIVLMALWALGFVSGYTLGGVIHILLVLAVVALIFRLASGPKVV